MRKCIIINVDRCSLNDGPGIRTVVFFKGCHLRCIWCHNPETYQFGIQEYYDGEQKKVFGYEISVDEIKRIITKDMRYYQASNGGVTLSGGEALLQIDAVMEILEFCKSQNIHTCIETGGHVPLRNIQRVLEYVDCWLYDYKLSNEEKYQKYVKANPTLIYTNLEYLIKHNQKIILRCPIISNINDDDEHFQMISKISQYVESTEILPYHNLGKEKAKKLTIKNYFYQENTTDEMKESWKNKLKSFNCKKFTIK